VWVGIKATVAEHFPGIFRSYGKAQEPLPVSNLIEPPLILNSKYNFREKKVEIMLGIVRYLASYHLYWPPSWLII
jgi:hypothetical protein